MDVDFTGRNKKAYPSRNKLAASTGLTVRQADEAVQRLKEKGLIHVQRRGLGKTNVYFFLDHEWIQASDLTKEGRRFRSSSS